MYEGNPPRIFYYVDESKKRCFEVDYENYLVHLGYNFNEAGQLKKWDPTNEDVTNEGYTHQSEEEYLELAQTLEYYVYNFLQEVFYMQAVPIGESFSFVSDNFYSNANNLLIMMNGKDFVRAGQWSTRCIVNEGFPVGSQQNYIKTALQNGWSVLCMNNNLILDAEGLPLQGSETPFIHAANVWSNYVQKSNAPKIIIMSQNMGGPLIFQLANMFPNDFVSRVVAVKIADSEHTASDLNVLEDNQNNPGLKDHICTITTNYIASLEPTGTAIDNVTKENPIAQISSGNRDKSHTFSSSFHVIMADFARIDEEPIISLFEIEKEVEVSEVMVTKQNETIDTLVTLTIEHEQIRRNEEVEDYIHDSEHITTSPVTKNEADPLIESTVPLPVQAEEVANPVARQILSYFKTHKFDEDYSSSEQDATDTEAPQSSESKTSSMKSTSTLAQDITESNNTPAQKNNFSETKIEIQESQEAGSLSPIPFDDTLAPEKKETKDTQAKTVESGLSEENWREKYPPEKSYAGIFFRRPELKKNTSEAPFIQQTKALGSETSEESLPLEPRAPAPGRQPTFIEAREVLDGDLRANFMVEVLSRRRQNNARNNPAQAATSGPSVPVILSDEKKKTSKTPAIPKKRDGLRSDTNISSTSKITRNENTDDTLTKGKNAIKKKAARRRTKLSRRKTTSYLSMTARSPKDIQITTPHVPNEMEDIFEPELFAIIGDDNATNNEIEQIATTG